VMSANCAFPLAVASLLSTTYRFHHRHANCRTSGPRGENERAAAQAKENYISQHEQIMEKEQERTQRQEPVREYYKKRWER